MSKGREKELLQLAKEMKTEIKLNAVEVRLILEIMKQYLIKIDAVFKLKKHRNNKDFIETRQLIRRIVEKLEDIDKENEKDFSSLTELKKSGKN